MLRLHVSLLVLLSVAIPATAFAWGDEGHQIIGLIADHYLDPAVRDQVNALLATDTSGLAPGTDMAHEATWADKYRDAGGRHLHYTETRDWHFADIEIDGSADLDAACFHHPAVPTGTPASAGPAEDCSVDKISEFAAELKDPSTPQAERLMALQFILHFVGDEHQPLHSSDDHDAGGNAKKVKASGLTQGKLHGYWDTQFVEQLPGGTDPSAVANGLIAQITDAQRAEWSVGTPADWAQEAFALAKDHAYGMLPQPGSNGVYELPASYVEDATQVVAMQLERAGVRLATVLNAALGTQTPSPSTASCTLPARAAAIPSLAAVQGISYSIAETAGGTLSVRWLGIVKSTLPFDASDLAGLQKTIEGKLEQAGWTAVESSSSATSYLSRWRVAVPGCSPQTGIFVIEVADQTSGSYAVEIEVLDL